MLTIFVYDHTEGHLVLTGEFVKPIQRQLQNSLNITTSRPAEHSDSQKSCFLVGMNQRELSLGKISRTRLHPSLIVTTTGSAEQINKLDWIISGDLRHDNVQTYTSFVFLSTNFVLISLFTSLPSRPRIISPDTSPSEMIAQHFSAKTKITPLSPDMIFTDCCFA